MCHSYTSLYDMPPVGTTQGTANALSKFLCHIDVLLWFLTNEGCAHSVQVSLPDRWHHVEFNSEDGDVLVVMNCISRSSCSANVGLCASVSPWNSSASSTLAGHLISLAGLIIVVCSGVWPGVGIYQCTQRLHESGVVDSGNAPALNSQTSACGPLVRSQRAAAFVDTTRGVL